MQWLIVCEMKINTFEYQIKDRVLFRYESRALQIYRSIDRSLIISLFPFLFFFYFTPGGDKYEWIA
jgi:hypothetical protein